MNRSDNRNRRPSRPDSPQNGNRQPPRSVKGRPMSNTSPNSPRNTPQRRPGENPQRRSGENPQRRPGETPQRRPGATASQRHGNPGNLPKPMTQKKKGLFSKKNSNKRAQTAQKPNKQPPKPNKQPNTQRRPRSSQQPNAKPVINKRASAAAAKAMNTKHAAQTRSKFRGGSYILYYLLAAFVLVIVLIILANTVLFDCKQIVVDGMQRYTADEIIDVSKIRKGDNLLHVDTAKAAEKIESELAYVESAKVERSFPTKIVITVTEAEKWYCINQFGVKAVISRGGKILEKGSSQGLVEVIGYEAESLETGIRLTSKVEGKKTIPEQILNAADKAGITDIDSIDMTDRYDINVLVEGRITLELGGITDIDAKMQAARSIIDIENEISPNANLTLLLTNPEQVAAQTNQPEEQSGTSSSEPSDPDDTSNKPENSSSAE